MRAPGALLPRSLALAAAAALLALLWPCASALVARPCPPAARRAPGGAAARPPVTACRASKGPAPRRSPKRTGRYLNSKDGLDPDSVCELCGVDQDATLLLCYAMLCYTILYCSMI